MLTENVITIDDHVVRVYDDVPDDAVCPYITLGAFTSKRGGSKDADVPDISQQIHIWSKYEGKAEVNEIAEDITAILTAIKLDLSAKKFKVIEQDIDMFEAFPEETTGYHGVLTLIAKIQNLGGN